MLTAATPSGTYAAAWAGASTGDAHHWVQAGIVSMDNEPLLYVESKGERYRIQFATWTYGAPVRVRVDRRGDWWRAAIGKLHTPWVRLGNAFRVSALELVNGGHASARINGRLIRG